MLPQFMFVGNKDVSPNIPLGNKKNYPKYSEVSLSGVLQMGWKHFWFWLSSMQHLTWFGQR